MSISVCYNFIYKIKSENKSYTGFEPTTSHSLGGIATK